jgi:hypothetical protein
VSTLPVVNIFTPIVEGVVENVLSRTPLKVSLAYCFVLKGYLCNVEQYFNSLPTVVGEVLAAT